MYEFIRGVVQRSLPGVVILEAGGVGYRLQTPLSTTSRLGPAGSEAMLLVHHTINAEQGEQRLYGFGTEDERTLFRALLEVKGIGPSTALTVLCAADPERLIELIASGDVAALKKFKGIGPKSAERIVMELRDKVAPWAGSGRATAAAGSSNQPASPALTDAVLALQALGYPASKSEEAVRKAAGKLGEDTETEALVRKALQLL
jgi:holliday junction DNA helicase RuvA